MTELCEQLLSRESNCSTVCLVTFGMRDEHHQGILAWQWHTRSAKPDSSNNLENEVKEDEQVSEDVEESRRRMWRRVCWRSWQTYEGKEAGTLSPSLSLDDALLLPSLLISLFFLLSLSVPLLA
eukprot:scaffold421205_cov51-Attheya_sp.AAC.1